MEKIPQMLQFDDNFGLAIVSNLRMRNHLSSIIVAILLSALFSMGTVYSQARELEKKFQTGLYAEEAKQDLEAAQKAYQEIMAEFDQDRQTAASALFRLGEVYRKKNQPEEAKRCFRRIAVEFGDREPLARLAKENLKLMGEPDLPNAAPAATGNDPEQEKILAKLAEIAKSSPELLLSGESSTDTNGCPSYDEVLSAGHAKAVEWFLQHGASPDRTPTGKIPLRMAAEKGHLAVVDLLISREAKLEKPASPIPQRIGDYGPLVTAALKGHRNIVERLLEKGADPNTERGLALWFASKKSWASIVTVLLDNKADPNLPLHAPKHTPEAINPPPNKFDRDFQNLNLPGSAPGNTMDSDLLSPLQMAAWLGNEEIVKQLLAHGATFDASPYPDPSFIPSPSNPGQAKTMKAPQSPIWLSCAKNHTAITKALLAAGIPPNPRWPEKNTYPEPPAHDQLHVSNIARPAVLSLRPIDLAIYHGNLEIYELLKQGGVSVKEEGIDPGHAVILALYDPYFRRKGLDDIRPDRLRTVETVLKDGADPNGYSGNSPIYFALQSFVEIPPNDMKEAVDYELLDLLKKYHADFMHPNASKSVHYALRNPDTIKYLLNNGADLNAVADMEAYRMNDSTALEFLVAEFPKVEQLEQLLAFKPKPRNAMLVAFDQWEVVKKYIEAGFQGVGPPRGSMSSLTNKDALELSGYYPATLARLWQYVNLEQNAELGAKVWFQSLDLSAPKPPEEAPRFQIGQSPSLPSVPMPPEGPAAPRIRNGPANSRPEPVFKEIGDQPMNIAQVLEAASGRDHFLPFLNSLKIIHTDPVTKKVTREEPVDLLAMIKSGTTEPLPILKPGDILAALPSTTKGTSLADYGSEAYQWFQAALTAKVTLQAGAWTREMQVLPQVHDFRWDPATSVIAGGQDVALVLQFLPKPKFFYNLKAVKITTAAGKSETRDYSKWPEPGTDHKLSTGDKITLETLPEDDPGLLARISQGIFIGREADGFLREVFHAPQPVGKVVTSEYLAHQVIREFCYNSESVLPYMDLTDLGNWKAISSKSATKAPWGHFLEIPRATADVDAPWSGPSDAAGKPLLGGELFELEFIAKGVGSSRKMIHLVPCSFSKIHEGWVLQRISSTQTSSAASPSMLAMLTGYQRDPNSGALRLPQFKHPLEIKSRDSDLPVINVSLDREVPFFLFQKGDVITVDGEDAAQLKPLGEPVQNSYGISWQLNQIFPTKPNSSPPPYQTPSPSQGSRQRRTVIPK